MSKKVIKFHLIHAIKVRDNAKIDELIEDPSKVNEVDELGNTPLIYAVFYNQKDTVKKLLSKNADESVINKQGNSAFFYVKDNEMGAILTEKRVTPTEEPVAVFAGPSKTEDKIDYSKVPVNIVKNYLMIYGVDYPISKIENILRCSTISELTEEIYRNGVKWIPRVDYSALFKMINKVKNNAKSN